MKTVFWLGLGLAVLVVAACAVGAITVVGSGQVQACLNNHADRLPQCLLARNMQLTVDVTGNVDEVLFYQADADAQPVGRVITNGQDTTRTLGLSTFPQYYFVVRKGSETYTSRQVGFSTTQASAHLQIRALDEWQGW